MTAVSVRQAVFADVEALAVLFDEYRQFQGQVSDVAAARRFLHARFDHGESVVFIAEVGAQATGFAQLYPSYSSVALARVFVLNDLFVRSSGRLRRCASVRPADASPGSPRSCARRRRPVGCRACAGCARP